MRPAAEIDGEQQYDRLRQGSGCRENAGVKLRQRGQWLLEQLQAQGDDNQAVMPPSKPCTAPKYRNGRRMNPFVRLSAWQTWIRRAG